MLRDTSPRRLIPSCPPLPEGTPVIDLPAVYRDLLRPWSPDELEPFYAKTLRRGERDLPAEDPGTRPLALLATTIPRLNSLVVAIYAMHVVTPSLAPEASALHTDMLEVARNAAAGGLLRCHLALAAELAASTDELSAGDETADAWRPVIVDNADAALAGLDATDEPPPAYALAQDAAIWVARAIELIDQQHPDRIHALTEALARLLVVSVFADLAATHTAASP
jgi:hypothetical protein